MEEKNKNLEKNKVNIYIDDKVYTLFTTEEEEYIQGVAKYINNKIKEISSYDKNITTLKNYFYIWLCLNIADDLFKHRQLLFKNKNIFQLDIDKVNLNNSELKEKLKESEDKIRELEEKLELEEEKIKELEGKLKENDTESNFEELEKFKNEIQKLSEENKILTESFNEFSKILNFKVENCEDNDELNEIIELHNKTIFSITQKIEKIRKNTY